MNKILLLLGLCLLTGTVTAFWGELVRYRTDIAAYFVIILQKKRISLYLSSLKLVSLFKNTYERGYVNGEKPKES